MAAKANVADRVTFAGPVTEPALVDLYSNAAAVVFPPYDEDFGYITLEAFLSRKPIVTTTDAGGPLEFVADGVTGVVTSPDVDSLAAGMSKAVRDRRAAQSMGDAGYERVRGITWDDAIDRLMQAAAQ
jgi:glycosyltransferase involved in cell wall biosynthesis